MLWYNFVGWWFSLPRETMFQALQRGKAKAIQQFSADLQTPWLGSVGWKPRDLSGMTCYGVWAWGELLAEWRGHGGNMGEANRLR